MIVKNFSKKRIGKAIFGWFFAILGILSSAALPIVATVDVYAEPETAEQVTTDDNANEAVDNPTVEESEEKKEEKPVLKTESGETCEDALDELGWLICPTTGKISQAVDWLYEKIEDVLVINPVEMKDGSPIYEIWKYCLGVANIVFIVFLFVVIYSQLTGMGISNYGVKKVLPKLIVAAVLVNLSFVICSLAVDFSNVIGNGVRGIFTSIEEATLPTVMIKDGAATSARIMMADVQGAIAGGTALAAVGGVIGFESGSMWMLIPVALGAVVAVASGLITIALRQAVVMLLIMVAPLAIVAYMLPNTESLFKKWKDLFMKMLVFYPMFSLLFGASSLAGYAIVAAAKDGFGLMLGLAVQIFPLFFSWSLMKMSGTILGTVNEKIRGFAAKPIAATQSWAMSRKQSSAAKHLASVNVYTPSLRLRQFLSNRNVARLAEQKEDEEYIRLRGEAYGARKNYKRNGEVSRKGEENYARVARQIRYQNMIDNHKANMEKGLGQLEVTKRSTNFAQRQRLEAIDVDVMNAADESEAVKARAEKIVYDNAASRQKRMNDALDAHMDAVNGYNKVRGVNGNVDVEVRPDYKFHFNGNSEQYRQALERYTRMSGIMENNAQNTMYAMANAANAYDVQKKVYESKMQKLFDYTAPTKDVEYRLDELTKNNAAIKNIDGIIAGLRVLNQRGDTDLVKKQLDQVLDQGVQLGTHASQALASFLMFEVKDNDPFLRRFGKYLNLETANMFNENNRKLAEVTYEEYVKGYHEEPNGKRMYAKKDMRNLMEGTSLDSVERTAFDNFDASLMKAYGYKGDDSEWDVEGYLKRKDKIMTAFEPAFLSAMQKWQSGSEQMNSGVKMWMGYQAKQVKDDNGNIVIDEETREPKVDFVPVWENSAFGKYKDKVKDFYRKKTVAFVEDQTVNQIQNMRTDARGPMNLHLEEIYFGDPKADPVGYKSRKDKYEAKKKEIMAKVYKGMTQDEADVMRKKELRNYYYSQIVGKPYREILRRTGKLEQMVRTSHSGGGNAMKDWNRVMTGLDDHSAEQLLRQYKEQKKNEREEERKKNQSADDTVNVVVEGAVKQANENVDAYRAKFSDDIRLIEEGTFYGEAMKFLDETFGRGDHIIKEKFWDYHRNVNPTATDYDLYRELLSILGDANNYE